MGQSSRDSPGNRQQRLAGEPGIPDGPRHRGLEAPHAAARRRQVLRLHRPGLPAQRARGGRRPHRLPPAARPALHGRRPLARGQPGEDTARGEAAGRAATARV